MIGLALLRRCEKLGKQVCESTMLELLTQYEWTEIAWIATSVFLMGVSKGGFPLGGLAMPILILIWPQQATAARSVVAFMLPLLCAMDAVSLIFYRKEVSWKAIAPMVPGTLVGVALASVLFVSDTGALVAISDRVLKGLIGSIGILFVVFQLTRRWVLGQLTEAQGVSRPGKVRSAVLGVAAGVLSTISHSAGPAAVIYFVPQQLGKLKLAGTMVAYFWGLNLIKLAPFGVLGRLEVGNLMLALWLVPVIPVGVGIGYGLVRILDERHYVGLIYVALIVTSAMLVHRAFAG
ncbi:MAG: sulfite exporter TauE/SafE family protein [Gemmatimonadetes bacterium]|nr:sulfite exporter TauE/SafE family protein [Gemmatimonadota bacterium]